MMTTKDEKIIPSKRHPDFAYSIWWGEDSHPRIYYKGRALIRARGKSIPFPVAPYPAVWKKRYIARLERLFNQRCREAEFIIVCLVDGTWRKHGALMPEGPCYELRLRKKD